MFKGEVKGAAAKLDNINVSPLSSPFSSPRCYVSAKICSAFEEELDNFKQKMFARLDLMSKVTSEDTVHHAMKVGTEICPLNGHVLPDVPDERTCSPITPHVQSDSCEQMRETNTRETGMDSQDSVKTVPTDVERIRRSADEIKLPDMLQGALQIRRKNSLNKKRNSYHMFKVQMTEETRYFQEIHPFRGRVRILVLHPLFDVFFGMVVLTSVVLMGVETEWVAQDNHIDVANFLFAQCIICILFIVEVTMRMIAFGVGFFGIGPGSHTRNWKWNLFDLLCTSTMVIDLSAEFPFLFSGSSHSEKMELNKGNQASQARLFRFFRLMRIVRALRCVRMVQFARELRKMSYALQYSFHTLLWAMLLLILVMFFFATAFTQATTEACMSPGIAADDGVKDLHKLYGTLPRSYFSLFQSITGGEDWVRLLSPLMLHTHWINTSLFLIFMAMTTFGVMNVITSVFVESALASVQHYKDLLIQESSKQKKVYVDHLRDVFAYIDYDNSGEISAEEMDRLLHDEELKQYLESIEIQPDDARTLFKLLDKDNSGQVNIDEFCKGCLRLKGDAKSYDIHCIIYENQRIMHKWQNFMDFLDKGLLPKMNEVIHQLREHQARRTMHRQRS